MNALTKTTESRIQAFRDAFAAGIAQIEKAATIYVAAIDEDEGADEAFRAALPGIPASAWHGMELVGRGALDKRLLWGGGVARSKMLLLSASQQRTALDVGVDVLATDGSALRVQVHELTRDQARMVFADGHIRSLAEQRAFVESSVAKSPKPAYAVKDGVLVVYEPCIISQCVLAALAKEAKR